MGRAVYGSWNDGSDIYKDKKGFFVVQWDLNAEKEYKRYLHGFKPSGPIAYIRSRTRSQQSKRRRTSKKHHVKK